jgi:DNA-binding MarR family transcriptional regulator
MEIPQMKHKTGAPRGQTPEGLTEAKRRGPMVPAAGASINDHAWDDLVDRGIRQWRNERPDLDSSGKAVVGRLLRLEEVVLRTLNEVLQPFDLKYQEYAVLATLRVAGPPYRLSPSRLQATLLFTSGGLSNLLKRLELGGLVRRSTDPRDGRGVVVKLTAKGQRLADAAMPRHAAAELHLLRMFEPQQRLTLAQLLSRMMVGNAPELGPESSP